MSKVKNLLTKTWTFLKEVNVQIKKIDWPTSKESLKYTIIVLLISFVLAMFLGGIDFGLTTLLDKLRR